MPLIAVYSSFALSDCSPWKPQWLPGRAFFPVIGVRSGHVIRLAYCLVNEIVMECLSQDMRRLAQRLSTGLYTALTGKGVYV